MKRKKIAFKKIKIKLHQKTILFYNFIKSFGNLISSDKNKIRMLEILLIVIIFWSSSLITVRTTALYYYRNSETIVNENEYLVDYNINQNKKDEAEKYQTIANIWTNRSERFRNHANHRTSGLVLCGYSTIFYFISILLSLSTYSDNKDKKSNSKYRGLWIIPFILSIIFLILSFPMLKSDTDISFVESINIFKFLGLLYY